MKAFVLGVVVGAILLMSRVYFYLCGGLRRLPWQRRRCPWNESWPCELCTRGSRRRCPSLSRYRRRSELYCGAQVYGHHCGMCHGSPGSTPSPLAEGMFPKPPQLFRGKGVTDDPPGETYWKVANGIRLTGMPEFKRSLSDMEMWQVSVLLANADKISNAVKQELKPPNFPGGRMPPNGPGQNE